MAENTLKWCLHEMILVCEGETDTYLRGRLGGRMGGGGGRCSVTDRKYSDVRTFICLLVIAWVSCVCVCVCVRKSVCACVHMHAFVCSRAPRVCVYVCNVGLACLPPYDLNCCYCCCCFPLEVYQSGCCL